MVIRHHKLRDLSSALEPRLYIGSLCSNIIKIISKEENGKMKLGYGLEEKLQNVKERVIPFYQLYEEQLNKLKNEFDERPNKHRVSINIRDDDNIYLFFEELEEATTKYKELQLGLSLNPTIVIDKKTINCSNITSIEFYEGKHPKEYTEEEIDEWAKAKLQKRMMTEWMVIKPIEKQYTFSLHRYYDYNLDI